jgi:hypothetical protein
MRKIIDGCTGFTITITNDNLRIDMPISNLVRGFNLSPNNYEEVKIRKGMRKEFVNWLADTLLDDADSESGDNFIATMLTSAFERAFEDCLDFVKYSEDEE